MKKTFTSLVLASVINALNSTPVFAGKASQGCQALNALCPYEIESIIQIPDEILRDGYKNTHKIENITIIKSEDFSDGYFVAGKIVESETNKSKGVGVWFAPDWYAMPGPATQYSKQLSVKIGRTSWTDSGNGYKIRKDVNQKSHGYKEIMSCLNNSKLF